MSFRTPTLCQSQLIKLLAGEKPNLMVVGDDDQAIYGWRGATLANILDFSKQYPGAEDVALIENYRSTQEILDAAYRLIQKNNPERLEHINKLDKQLHAKRGKGLAPSVRHFYSLSGELDVGPPKISPPGWPMAQTQPPSPYWRGATPSSKACTRHWSCTVWTTRSSVCRMIYTSSLPSAS
ncbi:MAG: UvrD-helicase domain-containing protein [Candidatus Saccharibacteria bacterium]